MYLDEHTGDIQRFACFTWNEDPTVQEKPVMMFSDISLQDMINIRDYMQLLLTEMNKDLSQMKKYRVK